MSEKRKKELKKVGLGATAFLSYMILSYTETLPFALFGIDPAKIPLIAKVIYLLLYQMVMLGIVALLFHKKLEHDFEDLKKNHRLYFKKYFKYWFLILGLMMVSNSLIMIFTNAGIATNEEIVRENFQTSPIYMFLSAVFLAPFLEELVFRLGFRYMFASKWVFIFLSGLVFGSLHVIPSMESAVDLLYLIPYGIPGFVFAYLLAESDNIFVPMGLHFVHNGILMSLQFVLYLFG